MCGAASCARLHASGSPPPCRRCHGHRPRRPRLRGRARLPAGNPADSRRALRPLPRDRRNHPPGRPAARHPAKRPRRGRFRHAGDRAGHARGERDGGPDPVHRPRRDHAAAAREEAPLGRPEGAARGLDRRRRGLPSALVVRAAAEGGGAGCGGSDAADRRLHRRPARRQAGAARAPGRCGHALPPAVSRHHRPATLARAHRRLRARGLLEKLLASPKYGEKWARHWLDLARYSDSNGYEKDLPREMWIWRDWVIGAFNRDLPYDRFVIEQIAGDLLPQATQDQIVATGFLRNSMLNEEGAIIPEEFRMVEMFDRVDCVGKAVLGLTTQCAQCHTHKFDPITHDEYYGLFAFLNDTHEARSYVYTPEQLQTLAAIRADVAAAEEEIRRMRPQWQAEMEAWAADAVAKLPAWMPITMEEMHSHALLTHPLQRADGSILLIGHRDREHFFEAAPDLAGATGLALEALSDGDLFMNGPGRDGLWAIGRMKVHVKKPDAKDWEEVKLVNASADFSEPESTVPRPGADPNKKDGSPPTISIGPVANLIDGDEHSAWRADRGLLLRHQPSVAVVQFEKPLDHPPGTKLKISLGWSSGAVPHSPESMLGCCRFSLTKAPAPAAPPIDYGAILAARKPAAERTEADRGAIFSAWRKTIPECGPFNDRIAASWAKAPHAPTTVMHAASRSASVRSAAGFLAARIAP
ncbi:DUF1549 domain-containing protein [bacterium]|nr:DUF1549 domain-containing protein [bacterium]